MKEVPAKISSYLRETRAEVKKVAWPDRKYVMTATIIIISLSFLIGFMVTAMDLVFAHLIMILNQVF